VNKIGGALFTGIQMHSIMVRKDVTETAHEDYLNLVASLFPEIPKFNDEIGGALNRSRRKSMWGNTVLCHC
jgi:hypothetical protein